MQPNVSRLQEEAGLAFYDPIEAARFVLYTDRPVEPQPADTETFAFPVETAVTIETRELIIPKRVAVYIRTPDGEHVDTFRERPADRQVIEEDRLLDVTSTAMKLYLMVPKPFELASNPEERTTVISLSRSREVTIGLRSFHERPAATIETPMEPEPVMQALTAAGSALKTRSCERAYPTLRGHPPAFEPAEELSIPDAIEPPDPDVEVRIPPKWEYIYPVAPLVFYLGATLRPGGPPAIEAGDWSYPLATPRADPEAFTTSVHRTLQQVFLMDCLTRTEGLFEVDLDERRRLDETLDLDFRSLYDAPIEVQLRAYLDVPYERIEPVAPRWHLCVDVEPTARHVPVLPYLLDDLALIRPVEPSEPVDPDPEIDAAVEDFLRTSDGGGSGSPKGPAEFDRPDRWLIEEEMFTLEPVPSVEHAYLGEGLPVRRNKASLETFERRLEYDGLTSEGIEVTIVCNDGSMADETAVEEYYGVHDLIQYSVDIEYELDREELAAVLGQNIDLLHYIGHIDKEGFACSDGHLDAAEIDDIDVDTFLLNACNSYYQGQALIDAGAKAGVTSLTEVTNDQANRLGRTMARALNAGFTLRSALALTSITTRLLHYLVLGDGSRQLVQCQSGIPFLADVIDADLDEERVTVDLLGFPARDYGQGSFWSPSLDGVTRAFLVYGHADQFELTIDQFFEYLSVQSFPVTVDGTLHWSNELDREKLTTLLVGLKDLRAGDGTRTRVSDLHRSLHQEK